jgi:tRNA (guanosine-2'-O-)-methyltransferase
MHKSILSAIIRNMKTNFLTDSRKEKIEKVSSQRQEGVVILEDIHDPHNAAAVLRSCDAFGIQKVCFIFEKQEPFNPKRIGAASSSSANKWLDFEVYASTKECIDSLHSRGYVIYGTALDPKAKSLTETKLEEKKLGLMFGNEHSGLSSTAIAMADHIIYIPMQGMVQSLNISVTAAVCLYALFTTRESKGLKNYYLDNQSKETLIKEWEEK